MPRWRRDPTRRAARSRCCAPATTVPQRRERRALGARRRARRRAQAPARAARLRGRRAAGRAHGAAAALPSSRRTAARSFRGQAWQVIVAGTGAFGGGSASSTTADPGDGLVDVAVLDGRPRAQRSCCAPAGCAPGGLTAQRGVRHARGREVIDLEVPRDTRVQRRRRAVPPSRPPLRAARRAGPRGLRRDGRAPASPGRSRRGARRLGAQPQRRARGSARTRAVLGGDVVPALAAERVVERGRAPRRSRRRASGGLAWKPMLMRWRHVGQCPSAGWTISVSTPPVDARVQEGHARAADARARRLVDEPQPALAQRVERRVDVARPGRRRGAGPGRGLARNLPTGVSGCSGRSSSTWLSPTSSSTASTPCSSTISRWTSAHAVGRARAARSRRRGPRRRRRCGRSGRTCGAGV